MPRSLQCLPRFAGVLLGAWASAPSLWADGPTAPKSSFLPPQGETCYYRYSETLAAPKKTVELTATLTVKTLPNNSVRVTFAADGKAPRTLDFRVDETGALQPVAQDGPSKKPKTKAEIQRRAADESLELWLALVSRVGANRETSFPVPLAVQWASGPVNPILTIKSVEPNTFVADAQASTTVNSPASDSLGTIGLGVRAVGTFGGSAADGFVGIAGLGLAALSTIRRPHGPQPADVSLHLAGELADGRLKQLSGDQENVVRPGKHPTTFSDKWILVAG